MRQCSFLWHFPHKHIHIHIVYYHHHHFPSNMLHMYCMTCNSTHFNSILFASDNLIPFAYTVALTLSFSLVVFPRILCLRRISYSDNFINFTSNAFLCIPFSRRLLARDASQNALHGCCLCCCWWYLFFVCIYSLHSCDVCFRRLFSINVIWILGIRWWGVLDSYQL